MKIIHNRWIPFRSFRAINLFGIVFVRHGIRLTETEKNHEQIHTHQQRELLFVVFYVWYLCEWIVHLIRLRNAIKAYYRISFEREAYQHEDDLAYLNRRIPFAFLSA